MSSDVAISNSSPLIYLAKLNRLDLLKSLYSRVTIPVAVYNEAVRAGIGEGHIEAKIIERAVEEGWIRVSNVKRESDLRRFTELDAGEVEVLSLARQAHATIVLIDDAPARLATEALGFNARGTIYVILRAAKVGIISKEELKRLLTELISAGFWISSEILAKILNEIG